MGNQQSKDEICRAMLAAGCTYQQIISNLHISSKRISAIKKGTELNHTIGRPKALTEDMINYIELLSLTNSLYTDGEITDLVNQKFNINVSLTTVVKMRRELGFIYRPPLVKQVLTEDHKIQRYQFCKWILDQPEEMFHHVIFSDESRFERCPDNSWRRIKRGMWNESCFVSKEKFNDGVMVWGAIGVGYKTALIRCSKKEDAKEYRRILEESNIIVECNQRFGEKGWFFMHDGAPCHNAETTLEYLGERVLLIPGWPPNSPDLNPIEMLWSILKKKLKKHEWAEGEDIYSLCCEFWDNIDERIINNLVHDFLRRCNLVLQKGGESISQHLSSHKKEISETEFIHFDQSQLWSKEQDLELMDMVKANGKRWKEISMKIGKSPNQIRNRYRVLSQMERNQNFLSRINVAGIEELGKRFPELDLPFENFEPNWKI